MLLMRVIDFTCKEWDYFIITSDYIIIKTPYFNISEMEIFYLQNEPAR